MEKNIIISILEKQEETRKEEVAKSEWGVKQRNNLVKLIEEQGGTVTNAMYDMLLFNIVGLRVNNVGKVCYLSYQKNPSKKILELLARYNEVIKNNLNRVYKN